MSKIVFFLSNKTKNPILLHKKNLKIMIEDKLFMRRCLDLAKLGIGKASPNPMVGSLLLHDGEVIGEGFHKQYGGKHAEVNCFESVSEEKEVKIPQSILFVSLEPCCFHGNTPACSDLIIRKKVKDLRISTTDKTPKVNGKGLEILKNADVEVKTRILENLGNWFVRFRTVFVTKKRPYIILKYAVSKDGYIGKKGENIWLTNPISKRLVHKWRSEVGAIMVGTNTALTDNPTLNNRYFPGGSPLRIVTDRFNKISNDSNLKNGEIPTWIIGNKNDDNDDPSINLTYLDLPEGAEFLPALFDRLVNLKIDTLLVEGGATLLKSFIDAGLWDEARVFETDKVIGNGIPAPKIEGRIDTVEEVGSDRLVFRYAQ